MLIQQIEGTYQFIDELGLKFIVLYDLMRRKGNNGPKDLKASIRSQQITRLGLPNLRKGRFAN
jgi:hypothetical protein